VLGGKTIELIHPERIMRTTGPSYFSRSACRLLADFPADALVTVIVAISASACGNFDQHPMSEWIRSFRSIEALEFDVLAGGHGATLFKKADVAEGRGFLEDLMSAVSIGMAAGKGLDELKRTVLLEQYKDWANYQRLRRTILKPVQQSKDVQVGQPAFLEAPACFHVP
jgi:hypothetical protein